MKKLLCLLVICSLMCSLLLSCTGNETPDNGDSSNGGSNTDTPDTPGTDTPDTPDTPDEPSTPDTPEEPNEPDEPDEPDEPVIPEEPIYPDGVNVTAEASRFYCADAGNAAMRDSFDNLLYRITRDVGVSPTVTDYEADATVIFTLMDNANVDGISNVVGRCAMYFEGGKLIVSASDAESFDLAKDLIMACASLSGIYLPEELSEAYLFNKLDYRLGKLTLYTEAEARSLPLLTEIKVADLSIPTFSPSVNIYTVKHSGTNYPTVSATPMTEGADVKIEQASVANAGVATVTVTVSGISETYSVAFYEEISTVKAEIINKNGADGTLCFVIDDGTESTATFMLENILGKEGYENVTASFALITKKIATLETDYDEDGNLVWKTDENGKYVYNEIAGKFDFWREILNTGKAYLISHTHTHTYPGDNDSGGIFRYKKNDGTYANTAFLPIDNVVMEHKAAKQIVEELSGSETYCLVTPGVGAPTPTYVARCRFKNGYLLARGTFGATDSAVNSKLANYVFKPEDLLSESRRRSVGAFMIEHFNSSPDVITTSSSTNAECLAAGIKNWTDFIDAAVEKGGWASFCIHEIRPDNYTGGDHHIYESQAKELFAYANSYGDRLWIAGYDDAARYYLAWAYANLETTLLDNRVILLTMESSSSDERLIVPLTVEVKIPDSWSGVTLNGAELEILEEDNGSRYVLVDITAGESISLIASGYNCEADTTEPTA